MAATKQVGIHEDVDPPTFPVSPEGKSVQPREGLHHLAAADPRMSNLGICTTSSTTSAYGNIRPVAECKTLTSYSAGGNADPWTEYGLHLPTVSGGNAGLVNGCSALGLLEHGGNAGSSTGCGFYLLPGTSSNTGPASWRLFSVSGGNAGLVDGCSALGLPEHGGNAGSLTGCGSYLLPGTGSSAGPASRYLFFVSGGNAGLVDRCPEPGLLEHGGNAGSSTGCRVSFLPGIGSNAGLASWHPFSVFGGNAGLVNGCSTLRLLEHGGNAGSLSGRGISFLPGIGSNAGLASWHPFSVSGGNAGLVNGCSTLGLLEHGGNAGSLSGRGVSFLPGTGSNAGPASWHLYSVSGGNAGLVNECLTHELLEHGGNAGSMIMAEPHSFPDTGGNATLSAAYQCSVAYITGVPTVESPWPELRIGFALQDFCTSGLQVQWTGRSERQLRLTLGDYDDLVLEGNEPADPGDYDELVLEVNRRAPTARKAGRYRGGGRSRQRKRKATGESLGTVRYRAVTSHMREELQTAFLRDWNSVLGDDTAKILHASRYTNEFTGTVRGVWTAGWIHGYARQASKWRKLFSPESEPLDATGLATAVVAHHVVRAYLDLDGRVPDEVLAIAFELAPTDATISKLTGEAGPHDRLGQVAAESSSSGGPLAGASMAQVVPSGEPTITTGAVDECDGDDCSGDDAEMDDDMGASDADGDTSAAASDSHGCSMLDDADNKKPTAFVLPEGVQSIVPAHAGPDDGIAHYRLLAERLLTERCPFLLDPEITCIAVRDGLVRTVLALAHAGADRLPGTMMHERLAIQAGTRILTWLLDALRTVCIGGPGSTHGRYGGGLSDSDRVVSTQTLMRAMGTSRAVEVRETCLNAISECIAQAEEALGTGTFATDAETYDNERRARNTATACGQLLNALDRSTPAGHDTDQWAELDRFFGSGRTRSGRVINAVKDGGINRGVVLRCRDHEDDGTLVAAAFGLLATGRGGEVIFEIHGIKRDSRLRARHVGTALLYALLEEATLKARHTFARADTIRLRIGDGSCNRRFDAAMLYMRLSGTAVSYQHAPISSPDRLYDLKMQCLAREQPPESDDLHIDLPRISTSDAYMDTLRQELLGDSGADTNATHHSGAGASSALLPDASVAGLTAPVDAGGAASATSPSAAAGGAEYAASDAGPTALPIAVGVLTASDGGGPAAAEDGRADGRAPTLATALRDRLLGPASGTLVRAQPANAEPRAAYAPSVDLTPRYTRILRTYRRPMGPLNTPRFGISIPLSSLLRATQFTSVLRSRNLAVTARQQPIDAPPYLPNWTDNNPYVLGGLDEDAVRVLRGGGTDRPNPTSLSLTLTDDDAELSRPGVACITVEGLRSAQVALLSLLHYVPWSKWEAVHGSATRRAIRLGDLVAIVQPHFPDARAPDVAAILGYVTATYRAAADHLTSAFGTRSASHLSLLATLQDCAPSADHQDQDCFHSASGVIAVMGSFMMEFGKPSATSEASRPFRARAYHAVQLRAGEVAQAALYEGALGKRWGGGALGPLQRRVRGFGSAGTPHELRVRRASPEVEPLSYLTVVSIGLHFCVGHAHYRAITDDAPSFGVRDVEYDDDPSDVDDGDSVDRRVGGDRGRPGQSSDGSSRGSGGDANATHVTSACSAGHVSGNAPASTCGSSPAPGCVDNVAAHYSPPPEHATAAAAAPSATAISPSDARVDCAAPLLAPCAHPRGATEHVHTALRMCGGGDGDDTLRTCVGTSATPLHASTAPLIDAAHAAGQITTATAGEGQQRTTSSPDSEDGVLVGNPTLPAHTPRCNDAAADGHPTADSESAPGSIPHLGATTTPHHPNTTNQCTQAQASRGSPSYRTYGGSAVIPASEPPPAAQPTSLQHDATRTVGHGDAPNPEVYCGPATELAEGRTQPHSTPAAPSLEAYRSAVEVAEGRALELRSALAREKDLRAEAAAAEERALAERRRASELVHTEQRRVADLERRLREYEALEARRAPHHGSTEDRRPPSTEPAVLQPLFEEEARQASAESASHPTDQLDSSDDGGPMRSRVPARRLTHVRSSGSEPRSIQQARARDPESCAFSTSQPAMRSAGGTFQGLVDGTHSGPVEDVHGRFSAAPPVASRRGSAGPLAPTTRGGPHYNGMPTDRRGPSRASSPPYTAPRPATARATASWEEGDAEQAVLLLVLVTGTASVGRERATHIHSTDLVCERCTQVWSTSVRSDVRDDAEAILMLPTVPADTAQELCTILTGYEHLQLMNLTSPCVVRDIAHLHTPCAGTEGPITSVVRVDVHLGYDFTVTEAIEALFYDRRMMANLGLREACAYATMADISYQALQASSRMDSTEVSTAHRSLVDAFSRVARVEPIARRTREPHPPSVPSYDSGGDHGRTSSKRTRWRDQPVEDVLTRIPQWTDADMPINEYQFRLLESLHSPPTSRVPMLLNEAQPVRTFLEAALRAHAPNALCQAKLRSAASSSRLMQVFEEIDRASRRTVESAQRTPYDRLKQLELVDYLTRGLAAIRSSYCSRSVSATLEDEAASLVDEVRALRVDSTLDFVVRVDELWTHRSTLWGPTQVSDLSENDKLSLLLPVFVRKLSPDMKDRALQFYNHVFHQSSEVAHGLPPSARAGVQNALAGRAAMTTAESPYTYGFYFHARRHGEECDPGAIDVLYERSRTMRPDTLRSFTTPDDLRCIARALLLEPHWRQLITRLLNGYEPTAMHIAGRTLGINSIEDCGHSAPEHDSGSDSDDAALLAPVERRTRHTPPKDPATQDRRSRAPRTSDARTPPTVGRADATSAEPSAQTTSEKPPRRAHFNPDAVADRVERIADKVGTTLDGDFSKLSERLISRLDDGMSSTNARVERLAEQLRETVSSLRESAKIEHGKSEDRRAAASRAIEQILRNLAAQVTDLKHAPKLRDAAAALGAQASTIERSQPEPSPSTMVLQQNVPVDDHISGILAAQGRAYKVDSAGFKLGHLPRNELNGMSSEVRALYAQRDNVRTPADYERVASRACINCPPDQWNMPHREWHCPLLHSSDPASDDKLGPQRAQRMRKRLQDNMPRLRKSEPAQTFLVDGDDATDDESEFVMLADALADLDLGAVDVGASA